MPVDFGDVAAAKQGRLRYDHYSDILSLWASGLITVEIENSVLRLCASNGAQTHLKTARTDKTCNSGTGTVTLTGAIPAGAFVYAVTARVTTILAGASLTTWKIGDGSTVDLWATGVALAAGTVVNQTAHKSTWTPTYYASAQDVVFTAAAGQFDSGVVTVMVHYLSCTGPTV